MKQNTTPHTMHQLQISPTRLQAAHQAAKARARKIAHREQIVISIYDLGEEIAQLEAEAAYQASNGNITEVITLSRVINRLKKLLPRH
jgi:hypothetical protein